MHTLPLAFPALSAFRAWSVRAAPFSAGFSHPRQHQPRFSLRAPSPPGPFRPGLRLRRSAFAEGFASLLCGYSLLGFPSFSVPFRLSLGHDGDDHRPQAAGAGPGVRRRMGFVWPDPPGSFPPLLRAGPGVVMGVQLIHVLISFSFLPPSFSSRLCSLFSVPLLF